MRLLNLTGPLSLREYLCPVAPTPAQVHQVETPRPAGATGRGCFALLIPGVPLAQPRHKAMGFLAKNPVTGQRFARARVYLEDSHPIHGYKKQIAELVRRRVPPDWQLDAPCVVGCAFVFPRPKSAPKKTARERAPKTSKPDSDNLTKAILDACKGITWNDDAQVCASFQVKIVGAAHEDPHTVIVFDQRPGSALSGAWAGLIPGTITGAVAVGL